MHELILLILVIVVMLFFDFMNGMNDAANAIATCISTRALTIRRAILMAAVLNFIGAIISTKIATTIGNGIVDAHEITQMVILSGAFGAILWGLFTWYFGIPSSSSHAIIGGICGATIAHSGCSALKWLGLQKIILSLLLSPIIGSLVGIFGMIALFWICRNRQPAALTKTFRKLQILSAATMAFAHGNADAQKSMGVITLALFSFGAIPQFNIPWEVMLLCAFTMCVGTATGGWRIIKTIGKDFVKLQPIHGFCVETGSAGVILTASFFGLPTSTTHVTTSAILGIGLSKRFTAVNWKVAARIACAALLTIPASALTAFITYTLIQAFTEKLF